MINYAHKKIKNIASNVTDLIKQERTEFRKYIETNFNLNTYVYDKDSESFRFEQKNLELENQEQLTFKQLKRNLQKYFEKLTLVDNSANNSIKKIAELMQPVDETDSAKVTARNTREIFYSLLRTKWLSSNSTHNGCKIQNPELNFPVVEIIKKLYTTDNLDTLSSLNLQFNRNVHNMPLMYPILLACANQDEQLQLLSKVFLPPNFAQLSLTEKKRYIL